eukprot:TRINITY_DN5337_c0_g1_i1.p1 TRINITY_DN5337_c0_g1~~TRINITY_DN5337_c0_g1_i1.p1  ORF type:complete len:337 (+),score=42.79 TRINITY_DN5337_c0_g1_i1:83-1093(+)
MAVPVAVPVSTGRMQVLETGHAALSSQQCNFLREWGRRCAPPHTLLPRRRRAPPPPPDTPPPPPPPPPGSPRSGSWRGSWRRGGRRPFIYPAAPPRRPPAQRPTTPPPPPPGDPMEQTGWARLVPGRPRSAGRARGGVQAADVAPYTQLRAWTAAVRRPARRRDQRRGSTGQPPPPAASDSSAPAGAAEEKLPRHDPHAQRHRCRPRAKQGVKELLVQASAGRSKHRRRSNHGASVHSDLLRVTHSQPLPGDLAAAREVAYNPAHEYHGKRWEDMAARDHTARIRVGVGWDEERYAQQPTGYDRVRRRLLRDHASGMVLDVVYKKSPEILAQPWLW